MGCPLDAMRGGPAVFCSIMLPIHSTRRNWLICMGNIMEKNQKRAWNATRATPRRLQAGTCHTGVTHVPIGVEHPKTKYSWHRRTAIWRPGESWNGFGEYHEGDFMKRPHLRLIDHYRIVVVPGWLTKLTSLELTALYIWGTGYDGTKVKPQWRTDKAGTGQHWLGVLPRDTDVTDGFANELRLMWEQERLPGAVITRTAMLLGVGHIEYQNGATNAPWEFDSEWELDGKHVDIHGRLRNLDWLCAITGRMNKKQFDNYGCELLDSLENMRVANDGSFRKWCNRYGMTLRQKKIVSLTIDRHFVRVHHVQREISRLIHARRRRKRTKLLQDNGRREKPLPRWATGEWHRTTPK